MTTLSIPEGHHTVMPYLILNNASLFFDFAKSVFGAQEVSRYMREGSTEIMHAEIRIGDSLIMFGQAGGPWQPCTAGLYVYVADADDCYAKAIAAGATSIFPPENKDYGRSGGVTDPFGNTWWITQLL